MENNSYGSCSKSRLNVLVPSDFYQKLKISAVLSGKNPVDLLLDFCQDKLNAYYEQIISKLPSSSPGGNER